MTLSKVEARALAKENILGYSFEFKTDSSKQVQTHISSYINELLLKPESKIKNIALYRADSWELKLDFLNETFPNLNFYYPRVDGEILEFILPESFDEGSFQIMEPVGKSRIPAQLLDLILVPGLGFGRDGHRLGRGKGFYDKSLSGIPRQNIAGVCFHENAFLEFAWESHDISVGILFTEKGKFSFLD
ncbi:MAG: hypothetical protein JJT78_00745 [Leptospira sp.]|nr:hypothetical protein [Leptospira sp.]